MSTGDNKHLWDEFIKKCNTLHPDGWEGAVREYAAKQNAIYEEWQRSVTADELAVIRTNLAVIRSNYATKEDISSVRIEVHRSIAAQTKWLAATMLGITGLAMAVAKLIF